MGESSWCATLQYGVTHVEQQADGQGQAVEAQLPGVRVHLGQDDGDREEDLGVHLGEDDGDCKEDDVQQEGEDDPGPGGVLVTNQHVDQVG